MWRGLADMTSICPASAAPLPARTARAKIAMRMVLLPCKQRSFIIALRGKHVQMAKDMATHLFSRVYAAHIQSNVRRHVQCTSPCPLWAHKRTSKTYLFLT